MIANITKNRMGTASFDGKFDGMRKAQDFIVYPMKEESERAMIQSDTRIGFVDLQSGVVKLSKSHQSGAYNVHLIEATQAGKLSAEELLMFKAGIFATASGKAGNNGIVYTDNSGAIGVFQS